MIANIYLGDGVKAIKSFKDNQFDLSIQDPPYFDGPNTRIFYGQKNSSIGVKRLYQKIEHWKMPGPAFFRQNERVSKNYIVFGCNYFNHRFHSGRICWDKVNDSSDYSDFELAATNLFNHARMFRFMWNGMCQGSRANGSVMEGNKKKNQKRIHPTEKPIPLYKWCLKGNTKPGATILDCFGGSMSIVLAALELAAEGHHLNLTVYEKDPTVFENARKRIDLALKQLPIFGTPPIVIFHS